MNKTDNAVTFSKSLFVSNIESSGRMTLNLITVTRRSY